MKHSFIIAVLLAAPLHAETRGSADYAIFPETADSGGGRITSPSYTVDSSLDSFGGISTSTAVVGKSGYPGQLYEMTGLGIAASTNTIDEDGSRQLSAQATLDDATMLELEPGDIAWSVLTGPLTGIESSGLVIAGAVYQDTAATAQGNYAGLTGTLGLTVLDSIPDNFGSYAADGVGDDWQFQYFGLNNPLAAPLLDPDGDGQNNRFEFTAGLIPTNPLSRFLVTIAPVPSQPTQKQVIFEPLVAGRSYTVKTSPDLAAASWTPLAGNTSSDNGNQRTVTDNTATPAKKFYTVEIVKP